MPPRLKVTPDDCSPLGRAILKYLDQESISMNRLAELAGVPQPRLRGACFKGTCPTPETLRKLARAMGKHHLELYTLAYEGRLQTGSDSNTYSLDTLVRELFESARAMDLTPPQHPPTQPQLYRALLELGFQPNPDQN